MDLPCIIESHKTLDNKQIFKIADISQMLLVEHAVGSESEVVGQSSRERSTAGKSGYNGDDYVYPHGITPPMQWARKRRFRKRIHNRAIETVEKEVDNLLNDDRRAERVEYEFVSNADADAIEDEIANMKFDRIDYSDMDSDANDDASAAPGSGDEDGVPRDRGENVDEDLAAELDAALAREHGDEDDEDDSASNSEHDDAESDEAASRADSDLEDLWDDDDAEEDAEEDAEDDPDADKDDDDGEEEAERRVRESQLEAECREIETLIRRKQHDIDATLNALIKSRHQQALRKLQVELDLKKRHLQDIKQLRRTLREERAAEASARASAAMGEASSVRHADEGVAPLDVAEPPSALPSPPT